MSQSVCPVPGAKKSSEDHSIESKEKSSAFGFGRNYLAASVADLQHAMTTGQVELVDVREQYEYDEGHLRPSKLIPLGQLQKRVKELDSTKPVYILCRSGARAITAAHQLTSAGFGDVRVVEGGILAWARAGYPVEHNR